MPEQRPPVVVIDGFKTLPLYYFHVVTMEEIPPFSQGKATAAYQDPEYTAEPYDRSPEWFRRIGSDAHEALKLVKKWHDHLGQYCYYAQFKCDSDRRKTTALHAHTALISTLCDARLGIDTTAMWSAFGRATQLAMIHKEYREDPHRAANYEQYASRLHTLLVANYKEDFMSYHSVFDRILHQIELKAPSWATLPPLDGSAPLAPTAARAEIATQPHAVITLHGINTRGVWQKDLATTLSMAGFLPVPLDFGNFLPLKLLYPPSRRNVITWFRDEYTKACQHTGDVRPSLIAHSFGTYVVARAIEKYDLDFDRLIFCGAIVRPEYPWTRVFENGRVRAVLNDYGREDFWARIVAYVVEDAGQSGYRGFSDTAAEKVIQREHPEFRHSDYFYERNYKKNWIPFLKGEIPASLTPSDVRPRNWRFWITVGLLALGVICLFFWYRWR